MSDPDPQVLKISANKKVTGDDGDIVKKITVDRIQKMPVKTVRVEVRKRQAD